MKKLFYAAILLLFTSRVLAQQETQTSLYLYNPMLFNPAYAGTNPYTSVMMGTRFQWVGIKGAPMTQYLSFNTGFKKQKIGFGLHVINDVIGARVNQGIYANIAYAVKLNYKKHRLAFGLSGGVDILHVNFTGLYVNLEDQNDPFRVADRVYSPNVGFGMYYYGENFFAGVSVPRVFGSAFSFRDSVNHKPLSLHDQHLYLTGGYTFQVSPQVQIRPSVLVKMVFDAPVTFDVNVNVKLGDRWWLGTYYRFNESVGANFSLRMGKSMYLGYAYDFPINAMAFNQWGTHELMIGIDLSKNRKRSPVSCFFN